MSAMLEVRGLEVNYGHIEAVRGIDLDLNAKEITALVGANGAAQESTTLLALSGLLPKASGRTAASAPGARTSQPAAASWSRAASDTAECRKAAGHPSPRMTACAGNLELGAYRRGLKNVGSDLEAMSGICSRA